MQDPRKQHTADDTRRGSEAYAAYGAAVGWKTHDGRPMPPWFDLGPLVQGGWMAVGRMQRDAVSRETSLAPPLVCVLIDEHAEGRLTPNRLTELVRGLKEVYGYGS